MTRKGNESSVSRLHRIRARAGTVEVLGGKITGYRAIAEEVTDAACRQLGARGTSSTAEAPLPGAAEDSPPASLAQQVARAVEREQCLRLSDFLLRRTLHGFAPNQGLELVEPAAELLAARLGWSESRQSEEVGAYRQWVRESRACLATFEPARS